MKTFLSSRYVQLTALSLLIVASIFGGLEFWAESRFRPIKFSPRVKLQIQREHPEVICIGNSMLGSNIEKKVFDKEIANRVGRPIRSTFIIGSGLHSAWEYLVVKNQIANAAKKGTPIIFFDYEDYYVRPEANTTATGRSETLFRQNMIGNESLFRSKIGTNGYYFASGFPYLYSQRFQLKRHIISQYLLGTLKASGISKKITSRKFRGHNEEALAWLFSTIYRGSEFRGGQADDKERNDRILYQASSDQEFENKVDSSFLPALLAYKDSYPMTFILSSSNPTMTLVKSSVGVFSDRLNRSIERLGGKYIDMNKLESLQVPGLMHDSRHFTKGHGRTTNTQAVVAELFKIHALDSLIDNTGNKP